MYWLKSIIGIQVQQQDQTIKIMDTGLKLDKNTLHELVIVQGLTPEEIAEVYGRKENNFYIYPPDEILDRIREYKISPSFIKGMDIIDEMKRNIREYKNTISEYSKGSKARYRKYDTILNKLIKTRKNLNDDEKNKELIELIETLVSSGITFREMVDIQQKDENIRLKYFKLKQDEVSNMIKAIDVQTKALEMESMCATMYAELAVIDDENSTNYAQSFLANVKRKTMEKVASSTNVFAHKNQYISRIVKKGIKNKKEVSLVFKQRKELLEKLANEYDIHFQTANLAWSRHIRSIKRGEKKEISECVEQAKEEAHKIYKYLDENGQKINKN